MEIALEWLQELFPTMGYGHAPLEKAKQVKATKRAGSSLFPGMLLAAGAARSNPAEEDDLSVSEGDLDFDSISSSGEEDERSERGRHLHSRFVADMAVVSGAAGGAPSLWLNGSQSTPKDRVEKAQAAEDRAESSDDIDGDIDIDDDDLGELEDDDDAGWTVRDPPPGPARTATAVFGARPAAPAAAAARVQQHKPAAEDEEQFSDIDSSFNGSDYCTDLDNVDLGNLNDELSDE
jgi:hypothetical protein